MPEPILDPEVVKGRAALDAEAARVKKEMLAGLKAARVQAGAERVAREAEILRPVRGGIPLPLPRSPSLDEKVRIQASETQYAQRIQELDDEVRRVSELSDLGAYLETLPEPQRGVTFGGLLKRPGIVESGPEAGVLGVAGDVLAEAGRVPFVQRTLDVLSRAASGVKGTVLAGERSVRGLTREAFGGEGGELFAEAGEALGRAGRSALSVLPFSPEGRPEDAVMFSEITENLGMEDEDMDIPLVGRASFKDVIDFTGEWATDPIILLAPKLGATVGRHAKPGAVFSEGTLPGRRLYGFGPRDLAKLPSDIAEQVRKGERALISVRNPVTGERYAIRILPRKGEAFVVELFDMARRGIASSVVGRALNIDPGPQFRAYRDAANANVNDYMMRRLHAADGLWAEMEAARLKAGVDEAAFNSEILRGTRKLGGVETGVPGEKAIRSRTGKAKAAARPQIEKAAGMQDRARQIRDRVSEKTRGILDPANTRIQRLLREAEKADQYAEAKVAQLMRESRAAERPMSASELAEMNRPAPPGGIPAEPAKAKALRAQANRIRTEQAKKAASLRARAERIGRDATKRASKIVRKETVPAVTLERDADFILRELDLRTQGTGAAVDREAALLEARRLFDDYRNAGFSVDESASAARAATLGGIDPIMAPYAMRFQNFFADGFFREIDAGIILSELTDPFQVYVKHAITDEGKALLKKSGRMKDARRWFNNEFYANAPFAKRRNVMWEGQTVPEINDWFRTHVEGFAEKTFFEESPLEIMRRRTIEARGPMRAAELQKQAALRFGRRATPELEVAGWDRYSDLVEEHNLQAHRQKGGGPAGPLIDVEAEQIYNRYKALDLGRETPSAPMTVERARREAISNLLERGDIVPTELGRAATFGGLDPRDILIPPEIAADMRTVIRKWADPKTPNAFLRFWDGSNDMFRAGATTMWPAFHFRNNMHNLWAVHLADAAHPTDFYNAGRVVGSVAFGDGAQVISGLESLRPVLGRTHATARELVELAENRGAFGLGSTSPTELGGRPTISHRKTNWRKILLPIEPVERLGLPERAAGATAEPGLSGAGYGFANPHARLALAIAKAPARVPSRLGRFVGEASEDFAKMTVFLNRLRKGVPIDQAARDVQKYLFDYSDISPFERNVAKRTVPFWTFVRKDTPLMLETLVADPGKIAQLAALQRGLSGDKVDRSIIPWHIQRGLWFATDKDENGLAKVFAGVGLGYEDLQMFDSWDEFVYNWANRLSPAIKMVGEQVTNRDLFRRINLDESELAPSDFRHLPEFVKDWMDFKPVYHQGQIAFYRANPRLLNFMRNAPVLNAAGRFISTSERFQTGEGAPVLAAPQAVEPLRSLTGIRAMELTERQQRYVISENLARHYEEHLQKKLAEGVVGKRGYRSYYIDRGIVPPDADEQERRRLARDLSQTRAVIRRLEQEKEKLSRLRAVERAALGAQEMMRGAGR